MHTIHIYYGKTMIVTAILLIKRYFGLKPILFLLEVIVIVLLFTNSIWLPWKSLYIVVQ